MDTIREYLLTVTAAAMLSGCICGFISKQGHISKILRLLCGLFLAVTVIKPVADVRIEDLTAYTNQLSFDADLAALSGENIASEEMKSIIKENVKTYIINKAELLDAVLEVEVILEDMVPSAVVISGEYSPFSKASIADIITKDLGIPEEAQSWSRQ